MTADDLHDKSWRSLWLSSGAMSAALLGDALIYVVLPVNASAFGISLAWVGVLLAANRIVRTFSYGMIAALGERIGFKSLCVFASLTALASTAMYGLFQGWAPLLMARVLWGLSYGSLILATLGYAAADRTRTGTRVGVSRAVEQVGPLVALTGGAWLAGVVGPRDVFFYLALVSSIAVFLALFLPGKPTPSKALSPDRPGIIPMPSRLDLLIFWMGFGVDGVFTMTLAIMFSGEMSIQVAMIWAGLVMSGRRVLEMIVAPFSGHIADRFGVQRPLVAASLLLALGLILVGFGFLQLGAIAIVLGRGALGTLIPSAVALFAVRAVLRPLARNLTWRDIGAAAGPLTTGFALSFVKPEILHLILGTVFLVALLWLIISPEWRESGKGQVMNRG